MSKNVKFHIVAIIPTINVLKNSNYITRTVIELIILVVRWSLDRWLIFLP